MKKNSTLWIEPPYPRREQVVTLAVTLVAWVVTSWYLVFDLVRHVYDFACSEGLSSCNGIEPTLFDFRASTEVWFWGFLFGGIFVFLTLFAYTMVWQVARRW